MSRNKYICLDTQITNWVFRDDKKDVDSENHYLFDKANDLIPKLDQAGYKLIVPQIVLSECACYLNDAEQNHFYNEIRKGVHFIDFTQSTSRILARLLKEQYSSKEYKNQGITRVKMKYDIMILACAIDYGALCFYTNDSDFDRYRGKKLIEICNLDELPSDYNKGTIFGTPT